MEKVKLKVGNILTKGLPVVKPSEMIKVKLSSKELARISDDTQELVVSCNVRE